MSKNSPAPQYYVLDAAGEPQKCDDHGAWAIWFAISDRVIAKDEHNGVVVSTVFLGLDHGFGRSGQPLLFETMVFGGPHDKECSRTPNRAEALGIHAIACGVALPPRVKIDPAAEYEDAMAGKEILDGLDCQTAHKEPNKSHTRRYGS